MAFAFRNPGAFTQLFHPTMCISDVKPWKRIKVTRYANRGPRLPYCSRKYARTPLFGTKSEWEETQDRSIDPANSCGENPSLLESQRKDDEECLIPEKNPNTNPNAKSLSGVSFADVSSGIDALYPPHELSIRNAKSRTDGYWKYLERGEKPPQQFTYGEFDVDFFGELLDTAWGHYLNGKIDATDDGTTGDQSTVAWKDKIFCDIGSGTGRLVIAAAALHPEWKMCRGLEILQSIHEVSLDVASKCVVENPTEQSTLVTIANNKGGNLARILRIPPIIKNEDVSAENDNIQQKYLPMAELDFICGSFTDPWTYLGDIDCAFVFSSCMKSDLVKELSLAIGRQCKPGTIVITTEFPLFLRGAIDPVDNDESIPSGDYEIELLEKIEGWCWVMGGGSAAYIHRVKKSLWEKYAGPRDRPQLPLEEDAFQLVQSIEKGELVDTDRFLKKVYNDMIFHGLPNEFLPRIDDD